MEMDAVFMILAIKEAGKSSEPIKCGAVVVKDRKLISKAYNSQRASNNATAHAEINAIIKAGKRLKNKNLDGCTIYCTTEPCIMCLSAMSFAKIKRLVYGVSLKDASQKGKLIDIDINSFLAKSPHKIKVVRNFMKEECGEIIKKDNPLKELFGFGKKNKITRQEFLETRHLLESKR